jgi:hypothetical protein
MSRHGNLNVAVDPYVIVQKLFVGALLLFAWVPHSAVAQNSQQLSDQQTQKLATLIAQKSKRFDSALKKHLSKSSPTHLSPELIRCAQHFSRLTSEIHQGVSAPDYVSQLMQSASALERMILCTDLSASVLIEWSRLHADLDLLAHLMQIDWVEAVVTRDLVAQVETDFQNVVANLDKELASLSGGPRINSVTWTQHRIAFDDSSNLSPVALVVEWKSRVEALRPFVKRWSLSTSFLAEWRRLTAQVEEIIRLMELELVETTR